MTIHCPDCGHLTRTDTPQDGYVYEVCTNDECLRVTVNVRARPAHAAQRIRLVGEAMRETRRAELREEWRERADDLDKYARRMRAVGDTREAEDAEAAAMDYRIAADDLEVGYGVMA